MSESEDMWRTLVNNLKTPELPSAGLPAPALEYIPEPKDSNRLEQKVFVQKVVTEVFVYTDLDSKTFGQSSLQTTYILGEMTIKKLLTTIEREKRKKSKE